MLCLFPCLTPGVATNCRNLVVFVIMMTLLNVQNGPHLPHSPLQRSTR